MRKYKCVFVIITVAICFLFGELQYRMEHPEVQGDLLSFTPKVETHYHTYGKRTVGVYVLDLLRKRQTAKDKADTTLFDVSMANNQSNAVNDTCFDLAWRYIIRLRSECEYGVQFSVKYGIPHSPPIKRDSFKKNDVPDVKPESSYTTESNRLTYFKPCVPLKANGKGELYIFKMYENKTETTIRNPNCKTYISLSLMPGRTGNDMFQIAALIGIAKRNGFIPLLNDRLSKMDWFYFPDLNFDFPLENVKNHHVEMPGVYADETENLNTAYNWTVRGYFQSWKYFENAASVVRRIFKIKSVYMAPAKNFLNSISKTGYVNVCLHYRRGDMLMTSAIRRGYTVAGLDFVAKAMTFYEQKFTNVTFVVLSDGIQWCRNNIKKSNVVFSPFEVAAIDFALLTLCDHVIVTSGTFGWWGAWLSRGTTAYYAGYPGVNTWLETKMDRSDYYPNDWIGIL